MKCCHIALAVFLWLVGNHAVAQSPFFWDDFDRESLWEGTDIQYRDEPDADITIDDGSVILRPKADNFPGIWADTVPYADVSLRSQVRFLDVASCAINPWIGLYFREVAGNGSDDSFWGGPATNGLVYIGESVHGGTDIRSSKTVFTCEELKNNDVHMQLDAIGNTISYRSWLDGAPKPNEPQLLMEDDSNPWGDFIGLFMNPDGHLSGMAVRYLALLPGLDGDFTSDGHYRVDDLNALLDAVHSNPNNRVFDLNDDGDVDFADSSEWLKLAGKATGFTGAFQSGDANLDGSVDATDLNALGLNWNQATTTWSGGDFNADGFVNAADLNLLALSWQQSIVQASPLPATVPEPSTLVSLMGVFVAFGAKFCRTRQE